MGVLDFSFLDELNLSYNDRYFCERVFSTQLGVYEDRLRAIGFSMLENCLDAGCGFGQWTLGLAKLNASVLGIDIDKKRLQVAKKVASQAGYQNLSFGVSALEDMPLATESLDGVFSYSVLYSTRVMATLSEMHRVLRPGGKLYLVTNGPGWYLKCLVEQQTSIGEYHPITLAEAAIERAISVGSGLPHTVNGPHMLSTKTLEQLLSRSGFLIDHLGSEGSFCSAGDESEWHVYPRQFLGLDLVIEALARKKL